MEIPEDIIIPVVSIFLTFLIFVLMWILVVWFIARLSGWHTIARQFPMRTGMTIEGKKFPRQMIRLGSIGNYNSTMTVIVAHNGIGLRPIWFFSFGCRPTFIQYSVMTSIEYSNIPGSPGPTIAFSVMKSNIVITGKSAELILNLIRIN